MVWELFTILLLGIVAGSNGQCDGNEMNITTGDGEISSPNYPNEYGKSANCSWKFTPLEGYALVLTIKYQRLYIVAPESIKICLGSYNLNINNDTQECTRYVNEAQSGSLKISFQYFDSMCSNAGNKPSVHVQYISDGRTYNGSGTVITISMGLRIQYKFLECPTVAGTTPGYAVTNILEETTYEQQASTNPDNNDALLTTKVSSASTLAIMSTAKITQADPTNQSDNVGSIENDATSKESDGAKSDGISDTTKLVLVSIPGFIGIIILVVTAIVFCRKREDKSQDGNKVEQENVGSNQMESVESPIQEPKQDNATIDGSSTGVDHETKNAKNTCEVAEHDEATTSTIQEEESPYTIMYSALARKDQEDEKKTSAIEEDEHNYDMYSAVVRKTERGDKEAMHV